MDSHLGKATSPDNNSGHTPDRANAAAAVDDAFCFFSDLSYYAAAL